MESNKSAALASSLTGIICDVRIRRSAGEHRTRLTSANRQRRRHWPPDAMARRCREFVDSRPRLYPAAPRRRPPPPPPPAARPQKGHGGKTPLRFPPPCPQVGGCPQASQHPAARQDEFDFGEIVKPSAGYRPLAYASPEAVQITGTVAPGLLLCRGKPRRRIQ